MLRATLVLLILVNGPHAMAQDSTPGPEPQVDATVAALMSFQPAGQNVFGPYLDEGLAGAVPGFNAALGVTWATGWSLALEVSSTTALETLQRGRFVTGPGPARARHRDTLLTFAAGRRFRLASGSIQPLAGVSLLFGNPERDAFEYHDPAGDFAITAGMDVEAPLTGRLSLVPSFRYSFAHRHDHALYFGLGSHIVRVGAGVRIHRTP